MRIKYVIKYTNPFMYIMFQVFSLHLMVDQVEPKFGGINISFKNTA